MDYESTAINSDGTHDLTMYRGEPLSAAMDHAPIRVDAGFAIRVEIRDSNQKLVGQYPSVLRVP